MQWRQVVLLGAKDTTPTTEFVAAESWNFGYWYQFLSVLHNLTVPLHQSSLISLACHDLPVYKLSAPGINVSGRKLHHGLGLVPANF